MEYKKWENAIMRKSDGMIGFEEVINYFSEESAVERKAMDTWSRLQSEQSQSCSAGVRCPISVVTEENTSWEERENLEQYNRFQEAAIKCSCCAAPPKPVEGPPVYTGAPFVPTLLRSIQSVLRPNKDKSEVNVYELACELLAQVRLVNYDGILYRQEGAVFLPMDGGELQKMLFAFLEPLLAAGINQRVLAGVGDMLLKNPKLCAACTTEGPERVFFKNGPYDLRRHTLTTLEPTDFFTSYIPLEYNPGIQECPCFDRFVATVSGGDPVTQQLIWEVLGYILSYDMSAKAFFVLQGVGDSGKSVFGNLVSSFFNPEALAHLDIYRFKDRFSTSALRGKRLNICMDLPRSKISREAIGTIKLLTGDDTITIEEKFRQSQSYKPTCKLLFGSNFPLMPADNDPAFRARLVTIPFRYAIPKERQDKHLLDKLLMERSAIAVKALDAYLALKRRNYQFVSVQGLRQIAGFVEDSELMEQFLNECCEFHPEHFTFTADLLEAYNTFRAANNVPPITDMSNFSRQLHTFCTDRVTARRARRDGKNLNGYAGIGLRSLSASSEEVQVL